MINENKLKYKEFLKKEPNVPIFSQDWWLDSVCGEDNWDIIIIEKGGKIVATMPFYMVKKRIYKEIKMPLLTQKLGPYIKYPPTQKYYKKLSLEKYVINEIIDALPKTDAFTQNLDGTITNWLPFFWRNFKQTTRYTYVIENQNFEEVTKEFDNSPRNRLKKSAKYGIEICESDDIKTFYEVNTITYNRKGLEIPYSFDLVQKLYANCQKNNACKILFAKTKEGKVIAAGFFVFDSKTMYYLMGGIDPKYKDYGAMDTILFEAIQFAIKNNKVFDFEGSMVESVEKYFRGFGAIQKMYFSIYKIDSKYIKTKNYLKSLLR